VFLSKIAMNTYHLWATTDFNNECIVNDNALHCHPQGFQDIIKSLQDPTTAKYVREPLAPDTVCINILLMNIRNSVIDPSSITFEDAKVPWYMDLLFHGRSATDTTGIESKIYGVMQANVGQNVTPHNPSLGLFLYHFFHTMSS
jgi:hypothetical protein